ncbi:MAG: carboxylesterase/lipase family protein [Acidobacteria bacterium]|nr:carboxylesterase/lipase family protein [Acidobacteriota bacterium]
MRRRTFLGIGGGALASLTVRDGVVRALAQSGGAVTGGSVIETAAGRIRGTQRSGVQIFKGVPYGGSTAGGARFLPPVEPQPWTGVRDASEYGPRAPQPFRPMIPEIGDALTGSGPMSEDCLRLNVWTANLGGTTRLPVMVWFHGGGFRTGSGNSIFYDGTELARKHGVVVVTVTHRLNVFGFLHLAAIAGERYRDSANLGMQDIVLALRWVRDNIAAFGGDPGNVTIFGQSGGGGKTSILQGMPSAKGLFHRAIIMSTLADTAITALEPPRAIEAAELLLSRLSIKPNEADRLQTLSMEQILTAVSGPGGRAGGQAGIVAPAGDISLRFTPVKDGRTLVVHPFAPTASPLTAQVPMMCGSNETEGVPYGNPNDPFWSSEPTDDASLRERVRRIVPVDDAEADRLIALYRKNRPRDSHGDLALVMAADNSPLRLSSYVIAERKYAQGAAPVFMYYFRWRSPVRGGKLRSMHCMEIPFFFDHVDEVQFMTGTGGERYALAEKMAGAFAAFARSGNPAHAGLPSWPAFDTTRRATMVFDTESAVVDDPFGEERRAMDAIRRRAQGPTA